MRICNKCGKTGAFNFYIIEEEIVCSECSGYSAKKEGESYNYEYRNKIESNPQSGSNANAAGRHNYPSERKSR